MFHLRDALSSAEFGGRVNDVFAALGTGSVKTPDTQISRLPKHFEDQQIERSTKGGHKKGVDQKKGEFKHPAEFLKPDRGQENKLAGKGRGRGSRGRYVPDHKKNPGKWTKYSLADVDTMTDKSNSAAAFDFLNTIKARKQSDEGIMETEEPSTDHKPVFKRPKKKTKTTAGQDKQSSGGSFVGSKHVLPEYVVGATAKSSSAQKAEKKVSTSKGAGNTLRLSHLDEEEDE